MVALATDYRVMLAELLLALDVLGRTLIAVFVVVTVLRLLGV
jgi:hypothetical protein